MTTELVKESVNLNKEITQWAYQYLSSHGYSLKSELPENVRDTPWSYVVRFATLDGYIYLKQTPKLLALEPIITRILHHQFRASVPEVVAHNCELNCFLMKDAGRPLREILKREFDSALFCKAIDHFTSMQLSVANHVNVFLDIGVPDWRLDKLSDLYMNLLSQKEILIADGLSEKEIVELENLLPKVSNLCKKLSDYAIRHSIVQPDFNDNNMLVTDATKNITSIDLGEIAISHPFFSLINCLYQAKKQHALSSEGGAYLQLMDACLKNYLAFEPKIRLLEAFTIARQLIFIYLALGDYRLITACDKEKFTSHFQRHGRLSIPLRAFLSNKKSF